MWLLVVKENPRTHATETKQFTSKFPIKNIGERERETEIVRMYEHHVRRSLLYFWDRSTMVYLFDTVRLMSTQLAYTKVFFWFWQIVGWRITGHQYHWLRHLPHRIKVRKDPKSTKIPKMLLCMYMLIHLRSMSNGFDGLAPTSSCSIWSRAKLATNEEAVSQGHQRVDVWYGPAKSDPSQTWKPCLAEEPWLVPVDGERNQKSIEIPKTHVKPIVKHGHGRGTFWWDCWLTTLWGHSLWLEDSQ